MREINPEYIEWEKKQAKALKKLWEQLDDDFESVRWHSEMEFLEKRKKTHPKPLKLKRKMLD